MGLGMMTFLAQQHIFDATDNWGGVGWGGVGDDDVPCKTSHLRKMLGWGGGDVNVPDTCTHVGCYARCWVGVGGMLTFLTLAHMLDATQDAGLGWGGC